MAAGQPADRAPAALVLVTTMISRDPRVFRQTSWLADAGWEVDTVGAPDSPVPHVRRHFALGDEPKPRGGALGAVLFWLAVPRARKFRRLVTSRIPAEALRRLREGAYDLVVFNDHDFLPLVGADGVLGVHDPHLHADLHEYVPPRARRDTFYRRISAPYRDWIRGFIGHPGLASRTTVVDEIAQLYASEFGIAAPAVVRNSPPYVEQRPRPAAMDRIRLLHHGLGDPHRGLDEMIDAMHALDDRFELTLMLVGSPTVIDTFRRRSASLGPRVVFRDPVPMQELATTVNEYDLEIMFYPPRSRNLEFALPNKFFEAVQGRLGVVIGESPSMMELVERHGLGVVVRGWTGDDLARELAKLTRDRVDAFKRAADVAARELSAETESKRLLSVLPPLGGRP